jgi:hypothetical protein
MPTKITRPTSLAPIHRTDDPANRGTPQSIYQTHALSRQHVSLATFLGVTMGALKKTSSRARMDIVT